MAVGLNRVMLIGNVGADPDFRVGQSGSPCLKIRVATTESFQGRDGARQERTDWHNVIVFGKRAEALSRIVAKGSQLYVEGRLQTSSYEKDGQKIYRTDVNAIDIKLLGGRGSEASEGSGGYSDRSSSPAPVQSRAERASARQPVQSADYGTAEDEDSDIPF